MIYLKEKNCYVGVMTIRDYIGFNADKAEIEISDATGDTVWAIIGKEEAKDIIIALERFIEETENVSKKD